MLNFNRFCPFVIFLTIIFFYSKILNSEEINDSFENSILLNNKTFSISDLQSVNDFKNVEFDGRLEIQSSEINGIVDFKISNENKIIFEKKIKPL